MARSYLSGRKAAIEAKAIIAFGVIAAVSFRALVWPLYSWLARHYEPRLHETSRLEFWWLFTFLFFWGIAVLAVAVFFEILRRMDHVKVSRAAKYSVGFQVGVASLLLTGAVILGDPFVEPFLRASGLWPMRILFFTGSAVVSINAITSVNSDLRGSDSSYLEETKAGEVRR